MTDIEVEFEALVASDSPSGRGAFGVLQEDVRGERESLQIPGQREVEQPSFFAVVAPPAPPGGENAPCSCDCEACSCPGVRWMERSLQSIELQLRFLMSKADDLHNWLVDGPDHLEGEALAAAVPSFLYTCQPFFNLLESTSSVSQHTLLPFDIYTRRAQLLDFSQQLCDRLEQLVLTYASCNLLCLDETNPNSVSHFCIGCSQVGPLRVTAFRYCKPTAYLAQVDSGLYKRMRWNVVGPRDERRAGGAKIVCDTEYYFLCYEDIPNVHADAASVVRMWSIGLWQQVTPDTDDIDDWVLCRVPQANYHKLLFLGSEEPSSCSATEYLQQLLLLSRPAPE
ncbi:UPF0575 protein C19orf67 homolog isoform X1 [Pungitius pungitius]|uniref:UPF0575 protein C19orf67 homolog isoform X1 n=1 Tax=Pungitius pungitius TaxID=134920 RepID=UPI001888E909|nr:UPF0575 protein C19orf67 homolog isoform X1 [Pungitius pungitius]XP_037328374.1 UPF0575 protein C19orf67 homolog isoform X1 [Pungitius pungitius]